MMTKRSASSDDQGATVALLEAEGTLCEGVQARRIDTHAAHIFLAGDRAWKLKRAVSLGYLDFSTCQRRRAALEAELHLNRRTAPDLYIAVHPLCRDAGGKLAIGGGGEVVDWLLEMRRFPDAALLATVAREGRLDEALIVRLADRIRAFHDSAEVQHDPAGHARVAAVIAGNARSMACSPGTLATAAADGITQRQFEWAARYASLLDERARAGCVRHGHGDLHLGNIALVDGEPLMFDCLEFDASLATTDTLYDLAFLLMDLWHLDLQVEANMLFNRYFDRSPEDEAAPCLLPLFLSMRATVRAHTQAALAEAPGAAPHIAEQARSYLRMAHGFLMPKPPGLVAIGGLSGTGKSSVARMVGGGIGRAPGARILRSDVLRKRLAGVEPEARLAPDAYTRTASIAVHREMERLAAAALHGGHAVILDAVFAAPDEREAAGQVARGAHVPFTGIWLEAPTAVLEARIAGRTHDASDADATVAHLQADYDVGELGRWRRVDASGSRAACVETVRAVLAGEWQARGGE